MDAKVRRPIALSGIAAFLVATVLAQAPPQSPAASVPPSGQLPSRDGAPSQVGTAKVSGRVLNTDNAALRNALIALSGGTIPLREPKVAMTDQQGRYEVADLAPGRYTLTASKAGYLTLSYGQRRPRETGRPVDVARDQAIGNIDFGLPKAGAILVRVTNEFGEPVTGVSITAHQNGYSQGERRLVPAGGRIPLGQSDDLGELRIHSLPPGDFYVSADANRPAGGYSTGREDRAYAETYYPGTPFPSEAQPHHAWCRAGNDRDVSAVCVTTCAGERNPARLRRRCCY